MHGNQMIMWVALAIAVGIPILILRRKRKILSGFDAFIAERKFVQRTTSPVVAFAQPNPPEGLHFSKAFTGQLKPGTLITLLMLRRNEAIIVNGMSVQNQTLYVGVHIPGQTTNTAVQKTWMEKAERKSDDVVYASPTVDGGFVVVWKGAPSRHNVEARFAALSQTLS